MKKNIFSIVGYSCAGKSTLIKQLLDVSNLTIIRYGDIHREAIKRNGYNLGMDWVKDKGFEDYENGALEVFAEELEKCNSDNIIIDGIFSYKCFQHLKNNKNINLINVLVETTFENRLRRMIEREGYTPEVAEENLRNVDWLKYYSGLLGIMKEADYIINSDTNKEDITRSSFKNNDANNERIL